MRNRVLSIAAIMAMTVIPYGSSYAQKVEQFYQLGKALGYQSLAFHEGRLWVGAEKFLIDNPAGGHEILVFQGDKFSEPTSIKLTHAPQFIQAYGPHQILAIGLSAYGDPAVWRSHFSVISFDASTYNVETTDLPDYDDSFPGAIYVKRYAAVGSREFFGLRYGENAVMEWNNGSNPRMLPFRITMPDAMVGVNGNLFVVEKDNTDNLIKIDLSSMKATRLFPDRNHQDTIYDVAYWNSTGLIAAAEEKGLMLIDPNKNQLVKLLPFPGTAGGLAEMGSCLLVSAVTTKLVHVIQKKGDSEFSAIGSFDFNKLGGTFNSVRSIAYDATNKQVFARATEPCDRCLGSPNGLARVWDIPQDLKQACGI